MEELENLHTNSGMLSQQEVKFCKCIAGGGDLQLQDIVDV